MSDMAAREELVGLVMRLVGHLNAENRKDTNLDLVKSAADRIREEKAHEYLKERLKGLTISDLTSIIEIIDETDKPKKRKGA